MWSMTCDCSNGCPACEHEETDHSNGVTLIKMNRCPNHYLEPTDKLFYRGYIQYKKGVLPRPGLSIFQQPHLMMARFERMDYEISRIAKAWGKDG